MRVVIDTCIWSFFLRRKPGDLVPAQRRLLALMRELIADGRTILIGAVRQELLSGIREGDAFDQMCEYLRYFDDEVPEVGDYEQAARFDNRCRLAGIAGSPVDMLLCSLGERRDVPILTVDGDFERYLKVLPIRLYPHP
jgi:predicted nucleic acid-binding protein